MVYETRHALPPATKYTHPAFKMHLSLLVLIFLCAIQEAMAVPVPLFGSGSRGNVVFMPSIAVRNGETHTLVVDGIRERIGLFNGLFDGIRRFGLGRGEGTLEKRFDWRGLISSFGKKEESELDSLRIESSSLETEIEVPYENGMYYGVFEEQKLTVSQDTMQVQFTSSFGGQGTWIITEPSGFGIISDIDDTIKVSQVNDKVKAVLNAIKPAVAVDGAIEYFKTLQSLPSASFHFISGSPQFLYDLSLRRFLLDFPAGTVHLRRGLSSLVRKSGIMEHKLKQINQLMQVTGTKKFILIGDSTQIDPEVYAEAMQTHNERIQCIYIRIVSDVNDEKEEELNAEDRFTGLFGQYPDRFRRFTDYSEIGGVDLVNGKC